MFEVRPLPDARRQLRQKPEAYTANRAALAVLVDPDAAMVEVHRPGHGPATRQRRRSVDLGPELAGFMSDRAPLFGG